MTKTPIQILEEMIEEARENKNKCDLMYIGITTETLRIAIERIKSNQ